MNKNNRSENLESNQKDQITNQTPILQDDVEKQSEEEQNDEFVITKMDNFSLILCNIIWPCVDIYSDIHFCARMLLNGHIMYGSMTLCPIIISTLFTIPHWWALETGKQLIYTFPFVFLQLWPQYRAARLFYLGRQIQKENTSIIKQRLIKQWKKEKSIYENDLISLGNI